jgi:hypothetical protein
VLDIADLHERATGVHVSKTLPCGDDHIVLLDYYQASRSKVWANLRRLKSTGDVVWAASPPGSGDLFTDVDWRDRRLIASTWEGSMIAMDQETGRPLEVLFTAGDYVLDPTATYEKPREMGGCCKHEEGA